MRNNKVLISLIILLLFFSFYEINNDFRIGGILRDIIYLPVNDNYKEMYTLINKELKEENQELKELLKIDYSLTDFEEINATVIERNSTYWLNEMTINKGLLDGIINNQIVITKDGMIGKIIDSSFKTSKIKLITSFSSPISITVNNINKLLTVDNYQLLIKGINNKDNIKVGDKVVTSGLQDSYPKGILIGEIKEIVKEKDDVGLIAKVDCTANLNNIHFVTILKRKEI